MENDWFFCDDCGEPCMQDPSGSIGVLVHGSEGEQDFDQDEDHVPYCTEIQ